MISKSYASYQHYGKWFKEILTDTSIVDPVVARMKCATELAQYAMATTAITFTVRKPGLHAGQMLHVDLTARGISGDYLIKRVTTTIGIGGHLAVKVELGVVDQGLVGLLIALNKATTISDSEVDSDDVLNHLLDFVDTVTVADNGVTVSQSSSPYVWGTMVWGYFVWG